MAEPHYRNIAIKKGTAMKTPTDYMTKVGTAMPGPIGHTPDISVPGRAAQ
jgi:hypothetical protein